MSWREPPTVVAVGPAAAGQSTSVAGSGPYNHGNHSRWVGGGGGLSNVNFRFGSQKKYHPIKLAVRFYKLLFILWTTNLKTIVTASHLHVGT